MREKKTWLITGGAGFIGKNLWLGVQKVFPNDRIVLVDTIFDGWISDWAKNLVCYGNDILNYSQMKDVFEEEHPNYVVHLAAKTDVRKSVKDPFTTIRENLEGTLNCVDLSYRKGVSNFIFVSSCGVVGDVSQSDERTNINPKSPYAVSKVMGELACNVYADKKVGFFVDVLRLSNVYGKHSLGKNSVIAKFIKNILNGEEIVINGDGQQTRDFVWVGDVVGVILALVEKKHGGLFCVSSFEQMSINKIVKILSEYGESKGYVVNVKYKKRVEEELLASLVNNCKIKDFLNFDFDINVKMNVAKLFDWFVEVKMFLEG